MSKCGNGGCVVTMVAKWLLVVGGLNWGLVGLGMLMGKEMDWNLVNMLLGAWPTVEAIVYLLVGVSAVVKVVGCPCAKCKAACASCALPDNSGSGTH